MWVPLISGRSRVPNTMLPIRSTPFAVLLLAISTVALYAQQASRAAPVPQLPDGAWWNAASPNARQSFLEGLEDCEEWDAVRRPRSSPFPSDQELIHSVSNYYEEHGPEAKAIDVVVQVSKIERARRVARNLPAAPGRRNHSDGGEIWTNRHWYFDGLWWKQLQAGQQHAYVAGYVSCFVKEGPEDRKVIDSISDLTRLIDHFYGTHPDLEEKKVADVLLTVGTRKSPSRR